MPPILWRDPHKSLEAAEAMKLTAKDLLNFGIIDEVINEPLGGAHRDPDLIAENIKNSLVKNLKSFENLSKDEIFENRKAKFLKIGRDQGFSKSSSLNESSLSYSETIFQKIISQIKANKVIYLASGLTILAGLVAFIY